MPLDAPQVRLLEALRPEDGILETSQRKPEKCLPGDVRSKLCPLVHNSELAPTLTHLARGC